MKFTSKKIFYFAFIIILIGIIWTMFFSKSREGNGPATDPCNSYNSDSERCTGNCKPGPITNGGFWCRQKSCSDYGNVPYTQQNINKCKSNTTYFNSGFYCKASKVNNKLYCSNN